MLKNSCLVYSNVNEVYQKLLVFCSANRFKVKESRENFYFIRATKSSFFFWRTQRLELEILADGRDQVQVTAMLYRNGKRKPGMENDCIVAIENFL